MNAPYPCLWFQGNARAAVDFYLTVFDTARIVETALSPEGLPGEPGSLLTIAFEIGGQRFLAINAGAEFAFSPAVSFVLECETQDEVDRLWDRLSEGGQPMSCGWVTDRFGVTWQVVPRMLLRVFHEPDSPSKRRVVEAMLTMEKLDIAALEAARDSEPQDGEAMPRA